MFRARFIAVTNFHLLFSYKYIENMKGFKIMDKLRIFFCIYK